MYVPGLLNVNEKWSSVSRGLDLNSLSSLATTCGTSSLLVHVTVAPTGILTSVGPKLKLSIFTEAPAAALSPELTARSGKLPGISASAVKTMRAAMDRGRR